MSTDVNQYADLVSQSQAAVATAVESWTTTLKEAFSVTPETLGQLDPTQAADRIFDVSKSLLAVQRDLTKSLIGTTTAAAETAKASITDATQYAERTV